MAKKTSRPRVVLVNRCFVIGGSGKLLIIKRSSQDTYYPGLWEVPGGKLDQGQDLSHAQEREVIEETGFVVELVQKLVLVDSFIIGKGKYIGLPYIVLFSVTRIVGGKITLSNEHSDYCWVTYQEMLEYELTPEVRKAAIILKEHLS